MILDHLQGRHVIGVYPLLEDEHCWFVAVDFDKEDWQEDVSAYVTTARRFGLAPAVERSRSGNGAHVWFFFAAPVPAADARKIASYMLTETMASRPELPMSSYDRLFPNQDTMPRGGFGNLIALPLQYEARQSGNTVFVDAEWKPIPDQWAYLAELPRIEPGMVREIAGEASVGDKELGVRRADSEDEGLRGPVAKVAVEAGTRAEHRRAAAVHGQGGPRSTGLRREGEPTAGPDRPDQAACGLPEPSVLREAGDAALHGADSADHRLHRGPARAHRTASRLPG